MKKIKKSADFDRDRLHQDLIKLGDMIADGLHYEEPWISREYKKISKLLCPDMYKQKQRKPTQKFIHTLKPCICGQKGFTYTKYNNGNVGFSCKNCGKETGQCSTNIEARDKWNILF